MGENIVRFLFVTGRFDGNASDNGICIENIIQNLLKRMRFMSLIMKT